MKANGRRIVAIAGILLPLSLVKNSISNAEHFYRNIEKRNQEGDAVSLLKTLISDLRSETEWLEFKGGREYPGGKELSQESVAEKWGRALGGFANTGAGVILWGIDASRDPQTKIDAAHAFSLVRNPAAFASRLDRLLPNATNPPVPGVEILCVKFPNADEGVVVCLIPESDFKPHRTEQGKQWYFRIGTSFEVAPISILRNLFWPRPITRFKVVAKARVENHHAYGYHSSHVDCHLANIGAITIEQLSVLVDPPEQAAFDNAFWEAVSASVPGECYIARRAIHPGESFKLFECDVGRSTKIKVLRVGQDPFEPPLPPVSLKFTFFGKSMEPIFAKLDMSADEIQSTCCKNVALMVKHIIAK